MMEERLELCANRISEIVREQDIEKLQEPFRTYFVKMAIWCKLLLKTRDGVTDWAHKNLRVGSLENENYTLYEDILRNNYTESYANPEFSERNFGPQMGQLLSFLYVELRSQIESVYELRDEELIIHLELFLEVFGAFYTAADDLTGIPAVEEIRDIMYWFVSDYSDEIMTYRVKEQVDTKCDFATRIILESDLSEPSYLYRYGEFITDSQLRTAEFIASLEEKTIAIMADSFTEGYRKGFEIAGKDLSRKKTVNIRFSLGFERVIRRAIENFRKMGLEPVIYRASSNIWNKRGTIKVGYYGAIANKQMEYDHREDIGLFLDQKLITRKKEVLKSAYESVKELAAVHAGPACMEIFGEKQFEPVNKREAVNMTQKQQQLSVNYTSYAGRLINEYIKGEERSFTIIAFPIPEIGPDFEAIFNETIRINTLDYNVYSTVQATIIDALDEAEYVEIEGCNENKTKITVMLHPINQPDKETKFENCVADVNIPVGEVFTSPQLTGTNGILHVTKVYLEGLCYKNLCLTFENGMIKEYSCDNYELEKDNKKYISDNILFHHESLPLGEFAIGTNTTAYMAAKKYNMFDKLPILIAEKMGPHFAVGDTCYSHAEDVTVYNPNGKEIIARDNEKTVIRKEHPDEAYYHCHTDITLPYDEIKLIRGVRKDGTGFDIIRDGRFVLEGCDALNEPFCDKN